MEGYDIGRRSESERGGYSEVAVDNSRRYDAGRRRGFKRFGRGLIYLTSLASLIAFNINPTTAFHAKEAREITIGENHGVDPDTSIGKGKEGREVKRGGGGGCVIITVTAEVVDSRDNGDDGPSGESSGSSGGNSGGSSGGSSGGDSGGGGPSGPGGQ